MISRPQIIIELGINHNGDFNTLINLANMAMQCGADIVKLQLRTPEVCVPKDQWDIPRQWFNGEMITYIEYRKRMEFTVTQLADFNRHMLNNYGPGTWSASVWDIPALKKLMIFGVPWIKIPSAKLTELPLIEECAKTGKPVILSTGMSTMRQIEAAVKQLPLTCDLRLMHCHSEYPVRDDEELNLRVIQTLMKRFGVPVGYSNHHVSPMPAIYSVFFGARFIECHLTLDRSMQGSDHAASLEKPGLMLLVREINRIMSIQGTGEKVLWESELPALRKLRGNNVEKVS